MDEQLRDLRPVRLVRRQRQDHLNRADELVACEGRQDQPAPLLGLGHEAREGLARVVERERRHVADRGAAGDAVVEDCRERVEVLARLAPVEPADLDLLACGHRGQSRSSGSEHIRV